MSDLEIIILNMFENEFWSKKEMVFILLAATNQSTTYMYIQMQRTYNIQT